MAKKTAAGNVSPLREGIGTKTAQTAELVVLNLPQMPGKGGVGKLEKLPRPKRMAVASANSVSYTHLTLPTKRIV